MSKPKFDPSKPFEVTQRDEPAATKPKFDPNAPFEAAEEAAPAEDTSIGGRLKKLFSPEAKAEYEAERSARSAEMERQRKEGTGLLQTEVEQTGNALTFGHLPQIEAGLQSLAGQDYVTARDENIKRLEKQNEQHPLPALAGTVAGTVAPMAALPARVIAGGGGLIRGALTGAAVGGVQAGLQNPGDVEGVVNPIQAPERLENAKHGAKMGGAVGLGAGLMSKGAQAMGRTGGKMRKAGEATAFKSSGAMLKDFRAAAGKDEVGDIGRFMLDEVKVKAGDTFETVAQRASEINKKAGGELDQIYNKATRAASSKGAEVPGFSLVKDRQEILEMVSKELGNAEGKAATMKRVSDFLNERARELGGGTLPPRLANDLKGAADGVINYSRNPLTKEPNAEAAFSAVRKYIEKKVASQVEGLGRVTGDKGLGTKLRDVNKRYGMSKRIESIANDRLNREGANQMFGLTDKIASGAGAVAGATAAANANQDPIEALKSGATYGLLGLAGSKIANRYGPATIARGLDVTGSALQRAAPAIEALTPSPAIAASLDAQSRAKKRRRGLLAPAPAGAEMPLTDKDTP